MDLERASLERASLERARDTDPSTLERATTMDLERASLERALDPESTMDPQERVTMDLERARVMME